MMAEGGNMRLCGTDPFTAAPIVIASRPPNVAVDVQQKTKVAQKYAIVRV
jgi:hypothetical protein